MIKITEGIPKKVSGLTSLFLSFPYNKDIENIIKSLEVAVWHKKDLLWEVPVTSLAFLLDNLAYLDDITLELKPVEEVKEEANLVVNYKLPPFKHQEEAIKYGLNHDKWLLLDSPGLGKTASVIHLAEELKEQRGLQHCLIICGIASLRANWAKEIRLHSNLSYITIGQRYNSRGTEYWAPIKERAEQIKKPIDEFFIIINIESIREDNILSAILNSQNTFDMIVLDECHKCAGTSSIQSKHLLKLTEAKYRIGMTGTLITNSPLSAYIPLKWIGVDHSTLTHYKELYLEYGGFGDVEIVGYKNLDVLMNEIESCSLRRTKDLMSLPPKNVINEYVAMSDKHRKFYDDIKEGVSEECDKIELNANNVLALITRLRQATSCPSALTSSDVMSSKIERCVDLVEDIVSQGDKVVVMATFKESVYQLAELLKEYKPLLGTGDMRDQDVSNNIDVFQQDEEHKVFICTYAKCSTGLTMNKARYMICLEECFTYAQNLQAQDRIHRVTNTQPVFIYNLICEGTVDERVHEIATIKEDLSNFMVDGGGLTDKLRKIIKDL